MKKTILTTTFCLVFCSLAAQAQLTDKSVEVNIKHRKTNYWIEVADRNCGATSNKINSYGSHYVWNEETDSKAREFMGMGSNEVGSACDNFRSGKSEGWRLPTAFEIRFMMSKLDLKETHAVLASERGDVSQFVYFPFAGYNESSESSLHYLNKAGVYWTIDYEILTSVSRRIKRVYIN